jgi:phenylpropionate dioxygenase-like ring-hydroxylating dioxygenase large terminal subunit
VLVDGVPLAVLRPAPDRPAGVFADRCPHRLVPLSAGTVDGGVLQCRYHGWQFDETGQCVAVPSNGSDGNIPPCADLPPGPAAREDDGAVWVRRTDVHEPVPLDLLSNVDPGLARAWHPVALLDELPATARLLDRDYSLTVAEGSVLAEPAPFAVTVRWGLVWLAPLEPLTGLFDDPDAEDAAYVGAWLPPARTNASAGIVADNFLDVAHFPSVYCQDLAYLIQHVQATLPVY